MTIPEDNHNHNHTPPQQAHQQPDTDTQTQTRTRPPPHVTPNILPCCIHHDGPVPLSRRYWNPIPDDKGECNGSGNGEVGEEGERDGETSTVYFRGRKLRGRRARVPEGYHGLLVSAAPQPQQPPQVPSDPDDEQEEDEDEDDNEGEEEEEEGTTPTTHATFTHLQLWAHETLPDVSNDAFARGLGEWIRFAEGVCASGGDGVAR